MYERNVDLFRSMTQEYLLNIHGISFFICSEIHTAPEKKIINFKNWIQIYAPELVFSLGKNVM